MRQVGAVLRMKTAPLPCAMPALRRAPAVSARTWATSVRRHVSSAAADAAGAQRRIAVLGAREQVGKRPIGLRCRRSRLAAGLRFGRPPRHPAWHGPRHWHARAAIGIDQDVAAAMPSSVSARAAASTLCRSITLPIVTARRTCRNSIEPMRLARFVVHKAMLLAAPDRNAGDAGGRLPDRCHRIDEALPGGPSTEKRVSLNSALGMMSVSVRRPTSKNSAVGNIGLR